MPVPSLDLVPLVPRRSRRPAVPVALLLALAACRSAPPPVKFDPDPVTKYRWRGELAPVGGSADAGSAVAPAPPPLPASTAPATATTKEPTVRTVSAGTVARAEAPLVAARPSGSAVVQPGPHEGQTMAFVTLRFAPPGTWWRWRLVEGDCTGGTAAGASNAFGPLVVSADGSAESTATLPIPAPRDARWAVQVLRPDGATPVACAPLRLSL